MDLFFGTPANSVLDLVFCLHVHFLWHTFQYSKDLVWFFFDTFVFTFGFNLDEPTQFARRTPEFCNIPLLKIWWFTAVRMQI